MFVWSGLRSAKGSKRRSLRSEYIKFVAYFLLTFSFSRAKHKRKDKTSAEERLRTFYDGVYREPRGATYSSEREYMEVRPRSQYSIDGIIRGVLFHSRTSY
jgi:hypothetical protein